MHEIYMKPLNPAHAASVFLSDRTDSGGLITFCGFDGSGKTTQIERLRDTLRHAGYDVVVTRQPTDWYRKDPDVRSFLDAGGGEERARILALIAAADRLRHVHDVIEPALRAGQVVLCDRYVYDTFALFTARGIASDFLAQINAGMPRPDVAFYLDVPTPELIRRLRNRDGKLKYEERNSNSADEIKGRYDTLRDLFTVINGAEEAHCVSKKLEACALSALAARKNSSQKPPTVD